MNNPWIDLPKEPDYVLPDDRPYIEAHNALFKEISDETARRRASQGLPPQPGRTTFENAQIHLDHLPAPFAGRHDAPVVILLANPRRDPKNSELTAAQLQRCRDALTAPEGTEFFPVAQEFKGTPGYNWWTARLQHLIDTVGENAVLNGVQTIELHGYHSLSYVAPMRNFPSQDYTFWRVEQAIERGSLFVMPWTIRHWKASVPDLMNREKLADFGSDVVLGRPPYRRAEVSPKFLEDGGFDKVVERLKGL